tara:strand:+ start:5573 stop:5875 length:303 start_codon:yes stop_codon:yes gene_type:complete
MMANIRLVQDNSIKRDWTKRRGPTDTGGTNPPGGDGVEARVAKLETHVEYIRRDLDEVLSDVKSIKSRMAYFAGAAAVVALALGWLANNRFEQIIGLIAQ